MKTFSILKKDEEYSEYTVLGPNGDSNPWVVHRSSPVYPLVHWMELSFLIQQQIFLLFKLKISSAQLKLCTSSTSFWAVPARTCRGGAPYLAIAQNSLKY
jgi:hypothetical protein